MVSRLNRPWSSDRVSAVRAALVALLASVVLLGPAVGLAQADTFQDIYRDYQRTQKIDPCKYTPKELRSARSQIGSDSDQYAPEFPDALDAAIAASGSCSKAGSTKSTSTGAAGGTSAPPSAPVVTTTPEVTTVPGAGTGTSSAPAAAAPVTPAPSAVTTPAAAASDGVIAAAAETPADDDGPAAWTWAALGAAIVLAAGLGWLAVNATGRIGWLTPVGHAMGEAGWRISLRWAEFRDWLRFGSGR